ncbi:cytochrome c oxidase subunit II [Sphingosinicella sp. LHD-64]|uniref:cytochrome c oxidase subunit II n=1 Tax=Sphingosinicella sp. LHD-64 TaxID=3072139 RepID=UPI0028109A79|nr:cytochrome c oxidase subunit II [Sphingosinicella sp. LHD-64]MDQ8756894.1 cytochrome c oxidase subunit II [Sphingosinicella sp. LHD-64]
MAPAAIAAVPAAPAAAPTANAAAPAPGAPAGNEAAAANVSVPAPEATAPTPGIGQPDGRYGLQDQVTPIGEEALFFHDVILLPLITIISLFVLFLLGWVIIRYRQAANPTPSRNTHNTLLEVVWTLVPVLILVAIAVPSIRLLAHQYDPPQADITVKAIGNQWYWEYEYPDHGVNLVSNMLPNEEADARGEPHQLAVDERMVVPVGATVKMIVTSNDVIHAWGVPAFWAKIDAVPGRLNETWFRTDRPGVYYGVCYELCGARHGYMPIAVEVVSRERFAQWVASKGGTMPGAEPTAAAPAAPAVAPAGTETAESNTAAPAANNAATAEAPATTNQSAPAN